MGLERATFRCVDGTLFDVAMRRTFDPPCDHAGHLRPELDGEGVECGQCGVRMTIEQARFMSQPIEAPCTFCGHAFDHDLLGLYGCPNCHGEGLDE